MLPTPNLQSWFYRGRQAVVPADDPQLLAQHTYAALDAILATTAKAEQRACVAGCAFCCHFPVGVTRAEAAAMRAELELSLAPAEFAQLRDRVQQAARALAPLNFEQQSREPRRCVLLGAHDRCLAYNSRAVACRGWTSLCRDRCESQYHRAAVSPDADAEAYAAGLGAHQGLCQAQPDAQTYELTAALAEELGTGR